MKILIVDDHPLVRSGLVSMLSVEDNIEMVIEASNINEAMDGLSKEEIDIAMIDLRLGREDGLEIAKRAKFAGLKTKVVVLTSSMEKRDFIRSKECGVDGYILKQAFVEDIIYALHVVNRDKKYYDPEILEYINEQKSHESDILTPREKEVAIAVGEGLDNGEIAKKLFVSQNTVKKHVSNIMAKLEMSHRTQVAIYINKEIGEYGAFDQLSRY